MQGLIFQNEDIMSIIHIEDLDHNKFIYTIENISKFTITEKLDGSNLIFGFDNMGQFYTSRESKSGERFYALEDYPQISAFNTFKSAHQALLNISNTLRKILDDGEAVETEILFGRQPNAIVYGNNYICFLRMVEGDNETIPNHQKIHQLHNEITECSVCEVQHVVSDDGKNLNLVTIPSAWFFTSVPQVSCDYFKHHKIDNLIDLFKEWLLESSSVCGISNGELINLNSSNIPKGSIKEVKQHQKSAKQTSVIHKLAIKDKLVEVGLQKIQPLLRTVNVQEHEDFGIEGVVLLNQETNDQVKIVDKTNFSTINQFNHAVRNQIRNTVRNRPRFETINVRGQFVDNDVINDMYSKLSINFGITGLNHITNIKRSLKQFQGTTLNQTVENLLDEIGEKDIKSIAINILNETANEIDRCLLHYLTNWQSYELKLKNGKTIRYSEEIHKRTLTTIAEIATDILLSLNRIQNENDPRAIMVVLFEKQLNDIHCA